jgi:succinyl-CoA synthetase beta subunit
LINILVSIVRCDRVAQGVVDAYKNMGDAIMCQSLFVYKVLMQLSQRIIDNSGMPIYLLLNFKAADQVTAALS